MSKMTGCASAVKKPWQGVHAIYIAAAADSEAALIKWLRPHDYIYVCVLLQIRLHSIAPTCQDFQVTLCSLTNWMLFLSHTLWQRAMPIYMCCIVQDAQVAVLCWYMLTTRRLAAFDLVTSVDCMSFQTKWSSFSLDCNKTARAT